MLKINNLRLCALTALSSTLAMINVAFAQEASRVWVDASGLHNVQAMLVEADDTVVRLMLDDGKEITMQIDQLSDDDLEYLARYREQMVDRNSLRLDPPPIPTVKPLPPIELPEALFESPEDAPLVLGPPLKSSPQDRSTSNRSTSKRSASRQPIAMKAKSELPGKLAADRSPISYGCPEAVIPIDDLDFNDEVSRPIAVQVKDSWNTRSTSIAFSVSTHVRLESDLTRQQILRCDFSDRQTVVAMQHDRSIELLDHDQASGISLLLLDTGPVSEGGALALAQGWDQDNLVVLHRRKLPQSSAAPQWLTSDASAKVMTPMKISWARLIDRQHVLAKVENSIVLWNFISGEPIYRIDRVQPRSVPAISGGKRYLAIPGDGMVDLHDTKTGKHLGKIRVERQIPGVSFSPYGNAIAIVTSRRLRVWNLPGAALDSDVKIRESLGRDAPVWVDHDFVLSSTGVLISLHRGLPVWKYDITGCSVASMGEHVAILRKSPLSQLTITRLPHRQAEVMLKRMDASLMESVDADWRIPGRSDWDGNQWVDREVHLGELPARTRR